MGDDLKAAEDFVTSAMFQLKPLLSGERLVADLPVDNLLHIMDQASFMSARGIARAAESVINAINDKAGESQINGRVISLYQLVIQYNQGLQEILAETTEVSEIRFDIGAIESKHAQAAETLMPLMSLVKNAELSKSLQFISGSGAPAIEQGVSLESLMAGVTDTLIAGARLNQKAVSVSYAVGDIVVSEDSAADISDFMKDMGIALICHSLEAPSMREARGDAASGQIGITAEQIAGDFKIKVECKGKAVSPKNLNVHALTDYKNLTALMSAAPIDGGMVIEARNISLNTETPDVLVLEDADILQGMDNGAIRRAII